MSDLVLLNFDLLDNLSNFFNTNSVNIPDDMDVIFICNNDCLIVTANVDPIAEYGSEDVSRDISSFIFSSDNVCGSSDNDSVYI
jgi:hypothetical protein